jgi:hypothetical protein
MLSSLKSSNNEVKVLRLQRDRDGDVVSEQLIGQGYGIFRSSLKEQMASSFPVNYTWVGIITSYVRLLWEGTDINKGDICVWRGKRYEIEGVHERYNIHGEFEGYWLGCYDKSGGG